MPSVNIISDDILYAEMLRLELADAGYEAVCNSKEKSGLLIIDLDSRGNNYVGECITFSSNERGASFTRPIPVDALIKAADAFFNRAVCTDSEDFFVYDDRGAFSYKGECVELSKLEHRLLLYMWNHRNETVSFDELAENVFGKDPGAHNLVRVYINYLRNKLDVKFFTKIIITVRGKGYMLVPPGQK